MASTPNTASQLISVPKGGGALQGIGEKFSPDLHTGTGNLSVPIALVPGRNGFQPELSLTYSTANGNGPFGMGWSLSIPGVSRRTAKGIPRYGAEDVFLLSGAEDLVPVSTTGSVTRYRPRTEGLFALIDHHSTATDDYWKVQSKDGLISIYGTPGRVPDDPAVVANPGERSEIFAWKLTETRDPFGNRIVHDYDHYVQDRDPSTEGVRDWDQGYPTRIRYADYTDGAGANKFLASVEFEYEQRPDPFSDYRSGFEIRTTRRCRRIIIRTHTDSDRLVRTYHLRYYGYRGPDAPAANGVSLLRQIQVEGHGDVPVDAPEGTMPSSEWLPPIEFDYSVFEPDNRKFVALTGPLPAQPPGRELDFVDLRGNGLPDILEMNGSVRYWRNRGGGRFDPPRPMHEAPAGLVLTSAGVQLLDANGDGRADLLVTNDVLAGYYPLRFGAKWGQFRPYRQAPTFNLEDPEVRFIDLDGDGVTDALRSASRLECYFNDPERGWTERREGRGSVDITFSDPRVRTADMSGDGLQDIVLLYDGNVEYWPNLGHGRWGQRIHMRHSPRFPDGYDRRRILLGDVDGDGLADIVYIDHREVRVWINQSGNAWSEQPFIIRGTPPVTDADTLRLVDIFGSGLNGVLWSTETSALSRRNFWFLDLAGSAKPYLLTSVDNHMGAVTTIEYASSTRFCLDDEKKPATRWHTPLPFPVQVVTRTESRDEISGGRITSEYRYHGGYWDGFEREFRGFGMVEQVDTEFFTRQGEAQPQGFYYSPPTLTKTWFHQGAIGDESGDWHEVDRSPQYWQGDSPLLSHTEQVNDYLRNQRFSRSDGRDALRALRGNVLRSELYALDGSQRQDRPYTVNENAYGLREESPPQAGQERSRIFFVFATAQRTTQWERGSDPMTQFTFLGGYDDFGQSTRQTKIGCPRGWRTMPDRPQEAYLATRILTTYATDAAPGVYIKDRIARTTSFEVTGSGGRTIEELLALPDDDASMRVFAHTLSFYDGVPFEGLPVGRLDRYGALVRTERLLLTEDILTEAYGASRPPYFVSQGPVAWRPEYPPGFRSGLPSNPGPAGYVYRGGQHHVPGWYTVGERTQYDFHEDPNGNGRGLTTAQLEPVGKQTHIKHDKYGLLPIEVGDVVDASSQPPRVLTTAATYNYRVLQPAKVVDLNSNETEFRFSPLGLLTETWSKGNPARIEGDRQRASVRLSYDFLAFDRSPANARQPVFVSTLQYTRHDTDSSAPTETIETREYSDGFGRLVQKRAQGEEVRFGDSVLGGDLLPVTQAQGPGTAVTGIREADPLRPNVVVSGWQVYDNKGRGVEKYEPFFDASWDYQRANATQGVCVKTFYDPRGQPVRVVNPDGSEQRTVFGVPGSISTSDLSDPNRFEPTPWETYIYDANDNAGRTHPAQSAAYRHHWNTPCSTVVDAFGRTITTIARNRTRPATPADPPPPIEVNRSNSTYDIRGNLLTVTDQLGRQAFEHVYDLADHPLRVTSIDTGTRVAVVDAAANVVESRDARGALTLRSYDSLNRPVRVWARNDAAATITLHERLVYGDDAASTLTDVQAHDRNLLGRLYRHYDEAGLLTVGLYDFKGNIREKTRDVIANAALASGTAFVVDWEATPALEGGYSMETFWDALNRATRVRYPEDVDGAGRKEVVFRFNRAGALESVTLDDETYAERIAYDAKGQRTLIIYGNGLMTRYAYDAATFRLVRLRTERFTRDPVNSMRFELSGGVLQDLAYEYDCAGNVVRIADRTPGCGVLNNVQSSRLARGDAALEQELVNGNALVREFDYDPLYRLESATGRTDAQIPTPRPWTDDRRAGFDSSMHGTPNQDNAPGLTELYKESYRYDPAGNMVRLRHEHGDTGAAWTRSFGHGGFAPADWEQQWTAHFNQPAVWTNAPGNHLTHVQDSVNSTGQTHTYDASGNLVSQNLDRRFEWDQAGRLARFTIQAGTTTSVEAHYLYDAGGRRVKKVVREQTGEVTTTVYVFDVFEYRRLRRGGNNPDIENNTLHVMDNRGRIATRRVGAAFPRDGAPNIRTKYHLGDHLGSSGVVVGGSNAAGKTFITREEYFPYGETSFGSFGRKRYRFTGKERDEESGLQYHGARYYAPWLARWVSADPTLSTVDGPNLMSYVRSNPLRFVDTSGQYANEGGHCIEMGVPVVGLTAGGSQIVAAAAAAVAVPVAVAGGVILLFGGWVSFNLKVQKNWEERMRERARRANEERQRQELERTRRIYGERLLDEGLINQEQLDNYIRTGSLTFEWQNKAGSRYWLQGDPRQMVNSLAGYQVYEYRDINGRLLYVGKSGGAASQNPDTWIDRLKKEHIHKPWIGEAHTVTVTSALSEMEALALEEALIPQAEYNKKPGEASVRFAGSSASEAAAAASKQPKSTFRIDVHPVRSDPF